MVVSGVTTDVDESPSIGHGSVTVGRFMSVASMPRVIFLTTGLLLDTKQWQGASQVCLGGKQSHAYSFLFGRNATGQSSLDSVSSSLVGTNYTVSVGTFNGVSKAGQYKLTRIFPT